MLDTCYLLYGDKCALCTKNIYWQSICSIRKSIESRAQCTNGCDSSQI